MSFSNVGKVWTPGGFPAYLASLPVLGWADSVTVHHTAFPHLDMRPNGLSAQLVANMQYGYQHDRGWSAGPHLFIDDDQIWGMTPLTEKGIHASSFNSHSIGIEMLGDYDYKDDPTTGRGAAVLHTSIQCVAALLHKLDKVATASTILFHRDDPKTNKTCPGKKIEKAWFVQQVAKAMENLQVQEEPATPPPPVGFDLAKMKERLDAIDWQTAQMRKELGIQ